MTICHRFFPSNTLWTLPANGPVRTIGKLALPAIPTPLQTPLVVSEFPPYPVPFEMTKLGSERDRFVNSKRSVN
jgi:hypothetical protein